MKTATFLVVALVPLCGCSRQQSVRVDAIRNGQTLMSNKCVAVAGLGQRLRAAGFDTNSVVFLTHSPKDNRGFTNDSVFVRVPRDCTHAQIRKLMDELEGAGVGLWPDSFTGKLKPEQQSPGGDSLEAAPQE